MIKFPFKILDCSGNSFKKTAGFLIVFFFFSCNVFAEGLRIKIVMPGRVFKQNHSIKLNWVIENTCNRPVLISANTIIELTEAAVPIPGQDFVPEYDSIESQLSCLMLHLEKKNRKGEWEFFGFLLPLKRFFQEPQEIRYFRTYPLYLFPGMSLSQSIDFSDFNDGFNWGKINLSPGKYRVFVVYKMLDYWKEQLIDYIEKRKGFYYGFIETGCLVYNNSRLNVNVFEGIVVSNKIEFEVVK